MNPVKAVIAGLLLLFVLLVGCACLFSSCRSVLKLEQSHRVDSTATRMNTDSIAKDHTEVGVKTKQSSITDALEWWKLAVYPQQPMKAGDTTIINNNYYPTSPAPLYTLEGGKSSREEVTSEKDSTWKAEFERRTSAAYERLEKKVDDFSKQVERKPGFLTVIMPYLVIAILVVLLLKGLPFKIKLERTK